MILTKFDSCPIENIEGYSDFNIDPYWKKKPKKGVTAIIRCYGEEEWIGVCIESCIDFFDEIIISLTEVEGDRTEDIVKSFKSNKIRILKYPFKLNKFKYLKKKKRFKRFLYLKEKCSSVHNISYYTNWGMSKSSYTHVAEKWDADHILRPEYATNSFKKYVLSKYVVHVLGYNIVTPDFKYISSKVPYNGLEIRFHKNDKFYYACGSETNTEGLTYGGLPKLLYPSFWWNYPVQQSKIIFNNLFFREGRFKDPIFFHTKLIKKQKSLDIPGKCLGSEWNKFKENWKFHGKPINVKIPDFVFKQPNDYLR